MKKLMTTIFFIILCSSYAFSARPITGVWKTIDDETGEAKSLVCIYQHQGKFYGRVIKLFKDPERTAVGIKDNPKIDGLDVIWEMKEDGNKFTGGKILDPKKGKIYNCEIWRDDSGNLVVRGKWGPFGRNQIWEPIETAIKVNFTPSIPEEE